MDCAGGAGMQRLRRRKITRFHVQLPPRNLLSCTFPLDQISSSRLHRLLKQHVGGSLKKVLPGFCRRGDGTGDTCWCVATRVPVRAADCYSAGALLLLLFILLLH